jgi:hypothetical protein
MRSSFQPYVSFMLNQLEGGGQVHTVKGDPGGTTCWGFAQKFNKDIDVTKLTEESATVRALMNYWIPAGCDRYPFPVDIVIFDISFNQTLEGAKVIGIEAENWQAALWERVLRVYEKSNPNFRLGLYDRSVQIYAYISMGGAK